MAIKVSKIHTIKKMALNISIVLPPKGDQIMTVNHFHVLPPRPVVLSLTVY